MSEFLGPFLIILITGLFFLCAAVALFEIPARKASEDSESGAPEGFANPAASTPPKTS